MSPTVEVGGLIAPRHLWPAQRQRVAALPRMSDLLEAGWDLRSVAIDTPNAGKSKAVGIAVDPLACGKTLAGGEGWTRTTSAGRVSNLGRGIHPNTHAAGPNLRATYPER